MKKLTLAVLFVEYNTIKYKGAFENLRKYLSRLPSCKIIYVIIDNKNEGKKIVFQENDFYRLQGNNDTWEFSGWQRGVDFLHENGIQYDIVLFANDAFEVNGTSYLKRYASSYLLKKAIYFNAIIGLIDTHLLKAKVYGLLTKSWICTNCFFVPKRVLDSLESIISVGSKEKNEIFTDEFHDGKPVFKDDAPINNIYREHIMEWLTERWHSRFELNHQTWNLFQLKTIAILNEALLTARARQLGYRILPYSIPKFCVGKVRNQLGRVKRFILRLMN